MNSPKFAKQLAALGLKFKEIRGDGNCLFRSLSDQIYGDESKHFIVRKSITAYIRAYVYLVCFYYLREAC